MYTIAAAVAEGTARQPVLADRLRRASRILHLAPPWKVYVGDGRLWYVPSETRAAVRYLVDVEDKSCTCPDYRQAIVTNGRRGAPSRWCKHRLAVAILGRVQKVNGDKPSPDPARSAAPVVTRKSRQYRPEIDDLKIACAEAGILALI